ncbi:MAG: SIS domain-containing protein [Gemmatimonadota bacterium]
MSAEDRFELEARHQLRAASDLARVMGETMAESVSELATLVLATLRGGGKLLLCGNGGSAADAQHIAAEYVVRFRRTRAPMAAIALTTDTSVLTAGANDLGFAAVFERQVRALGRPGDLLILHSTSGESENVIRAARAARDLDMATAALLAKGGGRLRAEVDLALVVPTDETSRAQEAHLVVQHVVCDLVEGMLEDGR